jgi:predicted ATPase/DNA-binding SARP family transcriptional activator
MDDQLKIHTLGRLAILRNGAAITDFDQRKVPALLVYLACTGRPHPREVLAELLWEDRPQSQSLANLRVVLSNLRKTVGPFVTITRETAGMSCDGGWWLDASAFDACLEDADHDPPGLEEAVSLYQGDFLDGFYIDSQAFEDWVRLERERLRFRAVAALDELIDHHTARGDYAAAIDAAIRLLQLDNLREETHRALLMLYAQSGQRHRALAHYETLQTLLADELGVEPMPDTIALYERIQAGDLPQREPARVVAREPEPEPVPAMPVPAAHHLPAQSTSFVGREREIAQIIDHLRHPDCRLLSLIGPGGIGKTRLALAVAERIKDDYARGAHFVSLAALISPDAMAGAIATALDFQFFPSPDSQEQQLVNYLRAKEMLIILDNIEHLLDGIDPVDHILTEAPQVTLIATSREALNLGWERRYDVEGLAIPDEDAFASTDAVRLFVDRARSAQPAFHIADERACVVDICQRVEGMPLGIELAASWLRVLPCGDIAGELFELESHARHTPARHRSLRALFGHTWARLPEREQRMFRAMAVFRGGFTRQAAEDITGATLPLLATLINKALLRVDYQSGRYHVHELLRQYAEEQLEVSSEGDAVRDGHSTYYLQAVAARESDLQGPRVSEALDDIEIDFENVRAAWFWAIRREDFDAIGHALWTLVVFLKRQIRHRDGEETIGALVQALETEHPTGPRGVLLGRALDRLAEFKDDNAERIALCSRSLAILRQLDAGAEIAYPLKNLSIFVSWTGDFEQMDALGAEALAVAEANDGDHWLLGWIKGDWGLGLAIWTGELDRGERLVREALAISAAHDYARGVAWNKVRLAWIVGLRGNWDEAWQLYQDALAVFRDFADLMSLLYTLGYMGMLAYDAGHPEQSARCLQEVLAIQDEGGFSPIEADITLSYTYQALGDYEAARRHLRVGLREVVEYEWTLAGGLTSAAMLAAHAGEFDRAVELVALALGHPSISYIFRRRAERVRDDLRAQLPPNVFDAAWARGQTLDLDETVRAVLEELDADADSSQ